MSCSSISHTENNSSVLAKVEDVSRENGFNKVAVSREDCRRGNTPSPRQRESKPVDGKVVDQLAEKVREEISYHKSQVHELEKKLEELCKLSGELNESNNLD